MFAVIFVITPCLMILNLSGLTDGKPVARLEIPEHQKVTTIHIPKALISREELVALAQYVMRMMASRINITLQAVTSHDDFPRNADHIQLNSNAVQSTTPTAIPQKYYEPLGSNQQTNRELTRHGNQKIQYPYRTVGEIKKLGLFAEDLAITGSGKTFFDNGARLAISERPSLTYEPFVRYADGNTESFSNQFDFEIIPHSEISTTTYIPPVERGTGDLPLMQDLRNSPLLPLPVPISSTAEEKNSRPPHIRIRNLTIERVSPSQPGNNAVMSVPFEAIITFTGQKPLSSKLEVENQDVVIPTRDPPDEFPPYFETIPSAGKKTSDSRSGTLSRNPEKNLYPVKHTANEIVADKEREALKPMKKRQTPRVSDLLRMLGLSAKRSKGSRQGSAIRPTLSSAIIEPLRKMKPGQFTSVTFEEPSKSTTTSLKRDPMFQRQEIEEDEEDEGSLGSVTDLLPLVIPILEDLSDPNTETDIAELLEAALPLIQDISQGDDENEGIDFVGISSPILASLSGPNRNGNGTVFQSILPLILPLVMPFIGPIVGPIIQGISNPTAQGGSSITPVIQALAGPLSLPTEPGGVSIASSLISGIIASLSKDLKAGGKGGSDVGALASTLVSGVLAGGSAGLSAKFPKPPPRPPHPGYAAYGQGPVPASSVDTLDLVGASFKEILGLTLQLVKSVISSVTGILGASSAEQPRPVYGPANANFRVK